MEKFQSVACIHKYCILKDIWEAAVGEQLMYKWEPHNQWDHYAVALKKNVTQGAVIDTYQGNSNFIVHQCNCTQR